MTVEILVGDCRDILKSIPDESVNCCVTSPPYFGLRDYGTGTWEGGQSDCQHVAQKNNRNAILIELNKEYVELIKERTAVPRKLPIGISK